MGHNSEQDPYTISYSFQWRSEARVFHLTVFGDASDFKPRNMQNLAWKEDANCIIRLEIIELMTGQ
jgi:hypothetical protein